MRRVGEVVRVLAKHGLADWLSGTELERPKRLFVGRDGAVLAKESHAARIRLAVNVLELLESYQRDLEQELADVADLIAHLRDEPAEAATEGQV